MKITRTIAIIATLATTFLTVAPMVSASPAQVKVTVDAKKVSFPDAKPYVEDNRVLIPVRFVSEALGAKVTYTNRTVTIKDGSASISMKVNSSLVKKNGQSILLDVPATIEKKRVYVPLRFVSEALGAKVAWTKSKLLVAITTNNSTTTPTPNTPTVPTTPTTEGAFTAFAWETQTDLAKALFQNNIRYADGKVTFTVPVGSKASYSNKKVEKLVAGQTYTFPVGEGYLSFSKVYPSGENVEGYGVFLDTKHDALQGQFNSVQNDAVVKHTYTKNGKMYGTAGTLTQVIALAQTL